MVNDTKDILIVDDNPNLLLVLAQIFKQQGYSVRAASDGFSALRKLRDRVPEVLLSDLNMPGMSGYELLSVVRRRFPGIAVVAMSGAYTGETVPDGVAADGFYAKGSMLVGALFHTLRAIEDSRVRQSKRDAAPIWIPGASIGQEDTRTTTVACPECLRTFAHSLAGTPLGQQKSCCPHCMSPVQLAMVRQAEEMDRTPISLSALSTQTTNKRFTCCSDSSLSMERVQR